MHLPHRGTESKLLQTRRRVFRTISYYSVITTCKQYQVIRFYYVKATHKVGQSAEYSISEVVQRWIAPDGKVVTVARPRTMSFCYYDLWYLDGDMEVRGNNRTNAYNIVPCATYPRQRIIPELRRDGLSGLRRGRNVEKRAGEYLLRSIFCNGRCRCGRYFRTDDLGDLIYAIIRWLRRLLLHQMPIPLLGPCAEVGKIFRCGFLCGICSRWLLCLFDSGKYSSFGVETIPPCAARVRELHRGFSVRVGADLCVGMYHAVERSEQVVHPNTVRQLAGFDEIQLPRG